MPERIKVSGVVKDSDGNPVADTEIWVNGDLTSGRILTDAAGRFAKVESDEEQGLPPGNYTLSILNEDSEWDGEFTVEAGKTNYEITVSRRNKP